VFDEGRLSDSHGRVADFRNTVIIMTSNLGQQELREMRLSNEKQEKQNIVDESSSAHTGSSGSASERVGEDEVDEALALHDATYTTMKNNLMNNDDNSIDSDNKSASTVKSEEKINDMTLELVNKYFSLEFVNRIDEVIMFNPLSMESVQSICRVQISKVKNLLTARGDFLMF
jgi:ATP-dependent Clp protease ATP-binding subunit ClpB